MEIDEFKAGLEKLGWKQVDFALSTGLSRVSVSNWLTGVNPLPLWAENYLGLLLKLHDLSGEILTPPSQTAKAARKASKAE